MHQDNFAFAQMSGKSNATLIFLPEAYEALNFFCMVLYDFTSEDIQNSDHDFSKSRLRIYTLIRDCVTLEIAQLTQWCLFPVCVELLEKSYKTL